MPRISSSVVLLRPRLNVASGGVAEEQDDIDAKKYGNDPDGTSKMTGLRELFEEAGVLLTTNRNNLDMAHAIRLDAAASASWQKKVHDDATNFSALLEYLRKMPALSSLHYWVTFITPKIEKRRFRTNFFIAIVDDANIVIDGGETVRYTWVTPQDALDLNSKGELAMLPPQYFVFNTLKECQTVEEVIEASRRGPRRLPILPHAAGMTDDQELILVYPGDEEHPEYKGREGARRRINVKQPMGKNGYRWECNLPGEPTMSNL